MACCCVKALSPVCNQSRLLLLSGRRVHLLRVELLHHDAQQPRQSQTEDASCFMYTQGMCVGAEVKREHRGVAEQHTTSAEQPTASGQEEVPPHQVHIVLLTWLAFCGLTCCSRKRSKAGRSASSAKWKRCSTRFVTCACMHLPPVKQARWLCQTYAQLQAVTLTRVTVHPH